MAQRVATGTGGWSGEGVRVADVLARLGELPAQDPDRRSGRVLNLVAVTSDEAGRAEAGRVIDDLAAAHPARTIVVMTGGPGPAGRIDATCGHAPGLDGGAGVERIGLTVEGSAAAAASAVMPLLRAGLPTFVWWPQASVPQDGWRRLTGGAARVIFDADRHPPGALARLVQSLREGAMAIGDLAWTALTPWRRLVAQLVDSAAWRRLQAGPTRLVLTGGGLQADLMAGWLRWLIGPALAIERAGTGAGLRGVALAGPSGGHLHIDCPGAGDVAQIAADWPGSVPRRRALPLPRRGRAGLLADELTLRGRDPILEAAVRTAARWT